MSLTSRSAGQCAVLRITESYDGHRGWRTVLTFAARGSSPPAADQERRPILPTKLGREHQKLHPQGSATNLDSFALAFLRSEARPRSFVRCYDGAAGHRRVRTLARLQSSCSWQRNR